MLLPQRTMGMSQIGSMGRAFQAGKQEMWPRKDAWRVECHHRRVGRKSEVCRGGRD